MQLAKDDNITKNAGLVKALSLGESISGWTIADITEQATYALNEITRTNDQHTIPLICTMCLVFSNIPYNPTGKADDWRLGDLQVNPKMKRHMEKIKKLMPGIFDEDQIWIDCLFIMQMEVEGKKSTRQNSRITYGKALIWACIRILMTMVREFSNTRQKAAQFNLPAWAMANTNFPLALCGLGLRVTDEKLAASMGIQLECLRTSKLISLGSLLFAKAVKVELTDPIREAKKNMIKSKLATLTKEDVVTIDAAISRGGNDAEDKVAALYEDYTKARYTV